MLVARIVGVDGDGRVAQHRLGPRRRDDDLASAVDGVRELEQLAVAPFLVVDLEIAERRRTRGTS
jgi:hypothetical protein